MFPLRDDAPTERGFRPVLTILLIAANVVMYLYQIMVTGQFWDFSNINAAVLFHEWGAVPACITGSAFVPNTNIPCPDQPYLTLFSSMFLHGGLLHLGGNMLFLWIFGDNIEHKFGRAKFLGIYLLWGVVAGIAHIALDPSSPVPAVGASGAISGIMGAYLVIFPHSRIYTMVVMLFFTTVRIPAKWFLPFWLVFSNLLPFFISGFGIGGTGGVAYMAHIGGFAIGLAFGYMYRKTHEHEFMYGKRYGWRGDY